MGCLDRFYEGIDEVDLLLSLEQDDESASDAAAIRRAAVVLLVSHFEGYLKQLCETYTDTVGTGEVFTRSISRGVRELHTLPRLAEILESNDDVQRHALLKKLSNVTCLWTEDARPPAGTLDADRLSRVVTNADSECIDTLFTVLGLTSRVCDGDVDLETPDTWEYPYLNIRLTLRDVVKCRNDVAHGDLSRKPTRGDLLRYMAFLRAFARRLDSKFDTLLRPLAVSPD